MAEIEFALDLAFELAFVGLECVEEVSDFVVEI